MTSPVKSRDPGCCADTSCGNASEANTDREAPGSDRVDYGNLRANTRGAATLHIAELTAATAAPQLAAARELLLEYGQFVIVQPGAARFCFGSLQQEAEDLPGSFIQQGGGSLLALAGGAPAGFVAWRAISGPAIKPDSWELKRLWVRPSARGLALGRRLTQAVLDRAVAARRGAIYLDTAPHSMASAHRLYLDMGFTPCAPYNDNPVEGLVWMVKFL
jgi:ribosomal protein S18 acetylase RimI-like enzyme